MAGLMSMRERSRLAGEARALAVKRTEAAAREKAARQQAFMADKRGNQFRSMSTDVTRLFYMRSEQARRLAGEIRTLIAQIQIKGRQLQGKRRELAARFADLRRLAGGSRQLSLAAQRMEQVEQRAASYGEVYSMVSQNYKHNINAKVRQVPSNGRSGRR